MIKEHNFEELAEDLESFCKNFSAVFQNSKRDQSTTFLQYIKGLVLGDDKKKNLERIEEKVPDTDYQQLQHFISDSNWLSQDLNDKIAVLANTLIGDSKKACLIVDESGYSKKGKSSAGVSRQYNGNMGKRDNCQVGVYLSLINDGNAAITNSKLYLPESWTEDEERCLKAGIPKDEIQFKTKIEIALEMIKHSNTLGLKYNWIGADAVYGGASEFRISINKMQKKFMVDVRKNQHIFLEDPSPYLQEGKKNHQTDSESITIKEFLDSIEDNQWEKVDVRDTVQGLLQVEAIRKTVWIWAQKTKEPEQLELTIHRRKKEKGFEYKTSVSNAETHTSLQRLVFMQCSRFWIEDVLKTGKQETGMGDYQVRKWDAWHHHMALCSLLLLFYLQYKLKHKKTTPLLSYYDLKVILAFILPKRDCTKQEIIRQLEMRHKKRQSSINFYKKKQQYQLVGLPSG